MTTSLETAREEILKETLDRLTRAVGKLPMGGMENDGERGLIYEFVVSWRKAQEVLGIDLSVELQTEEARIKSALRRVHAYATEHVSAGGSITLKHLDHIIGICEEVMGDDI